MDSLPFQALLKRSLPPNTPAQTILCISQFAAEDTVTDGFFSPALIAQISTLLKQWVGDYGKIRIVGWSFGVLMGGVLCEQLRRIGWDVTEFVAIGGTFKPMDRAYGIAPQTMALTYKTLSEASYRTFVARMTGNALDFSHFWNNRPHRTQEGLKRELGALMQWCDVAPMPVMTRLPMKVYILQRDAIMSARAQMRFWSTQSFMQHMELIEVDADHWCPDVFAKTLITLDGV